MNAICHWFQSVCRSDHGSRSGLLRTVFLSALVGLATGAGSVCLILLLQAATWLFLGRIAGYDPPIPSHEPNLFDFPPVRAGGPIRWLILLLPPLGGLLSGWFVAKLAPEAAGHGTDSAIEAYHHKGGRVRLRVPPVKSLASAILIGTGGSAGLEGPISQIGSGIGAAVSSLFRLSTAQRRRLMAAGMAGGVGALFHAPLAGAIFAAEVLYSDTELEYEVLVPSVISATTSYAVFSSVFGFHPLFATPAIEFNAARKLVAYLVLLAAVVVGSRLYTGCFYAVADRFARLRIAPWWKTALGGLVTGVVGFFFLPAIGTGYGFVQSALLTDGPLTPELSRLAEGLPRVGIGLLLGIAVLKTVTTSFTVGSGGAGGLFGPAIVIGGALGGAVGLAMQRLLPSWGLSVGAFTIIGMVSFFACVAKTPLSIILMVSEMTGNYGFIVPSMFICILAYVLNRDVRLYRSQLPNRFDAPVHRGEMISGILSNLRASDIIAVAPGAYASLAAFSSVRRDEPLTTIARKLAETDEPLFPVVDEDGAIVGTISPQAVRPLVTASPDLWEGLLAEDVMKSPGAVARPGDTLQSVLLQMSMGHEDAVVVRTEADPPRPAAILAHDAVIAAYESEVAARR